MFIVQSESDEETFYTVDMESGYCECIQGMLRGPQSLYHYIAEGIVLSAQWYRSLDKPAEEITVYAEVHTPQPEIVGEPNDNSEETEAEVGDVGDVTVDGDVGDVGDVGDDEAEIGYHGEVIQILNLKQSTLTIWKNSKPKIYRIFLMKE